MARNVGPVEPGNYLEQILQEEQRQREESPGEWRLDLKP
jgi:hypothetical protein